MIQITDQAKEYLESMTEDEGKKYAHLSVNGGGCSGFQYKWDMVNDDTEGTLIDNILVLDKMAEMFKSGENFFIKQVLRFCKRGFYSCRWWL